jgi:dolichol-phosphate mannosyltransferase
VVLPVFNEEATLPELWRRLSSVLRELDGPAEVLFVDDGSRDGSREVIRRLCGERRDVRGVFLSRNFGQQAALSAGLDRARGQAVIMMDADLQDPPEAILDFARKWREGWDVVYAVRELRKEGVLKRIAFASFYRVLRLVSAVPLPLDAGIFSLMDRRVVDALRRMPERHKYLSGLRAYAGFRQIGVAVERGWRYAGRPRVSLGMLITLACDGILSFSTVPLRLATVTGLCCALVSFAVAVAGLYYKYVLHERLLSWPFGLTTVFFLGGVQLVFLGILGEYLARVYDEVKRRPYYLVEQLVGFEASADHPRATDGTRSGDPRA